MHRTWSQQCKLLLAKPSRRGLHQWNSQTVLFKLYFREGSLGRSTGWNPCNSHLDPSHVDVCHDNTGSMVQQEKWYPGVSSSSQLCFSPFPSSKTTKKEREKLVRRLSDLLKWNLWDTETETMLLWTKSCLLLLPKVTASELGYWCCWCKALYFHQASSSWNSQAALRNRSVSRQMDPLLQKGWSYFT